MKKTSSKSYTMNNGKSENMSFEKESRGDRSFQAKSLSISPLNLGTLTSNTTNYMDTGSEASSQKHYKNQGSSPNYESQYYKLSSAVKELFLEMKSRMLRDDPNCALILKKTVPMEQDQDYFRNADPMVLVQYAKKIHDKTAEFKREAENELSSKKENECSDYEALLQKLEAEVRQHIRIEQQLKLHVESTQAKLDDLEKVHDPVKMEAMRKENEELKNTTYSLGEKLKKRENEIEGLKKELHAKNNMIKDLEQQNENLPIMKNKIRELEKVIAQGGAGSGTTGGNRSSSSNVLKGSNKSNKEVESSEKTSTFLNQFYSGENKVRKGSQPGLGLHAHEFSKQRQQHDKENLETYKLDLSRNIYEGSKGYRSNSQSEIQKSVETSKVDISINKGSSKREEKGDDFNSVLERMKKSLKSNNRNVSKEDLRTSDQTIIPDDLNENTHDRTFDQKMYKKEADSIRSNYDNKRMKSGQSFTEYDRKIWEKMEYRGDAKPPSNNKSGYPKDHHYDNDSHTQQRGGVPKPRPSGNNDHMNNSYIDYKYKKETEIYDLNKLKVNSPKKLSQDRSMSVDGKQKLYKQLKSNPEILNKMHAENDSHNNSRFSISSKDMYQHNGSVLKGSYI